MFLLRILGLWCLLLAMIALVVDGTKSLGGGGAWIITPLGDEWARLSPASLEAAKTAVVQHTTPALWDPVIVTLLQAPAWFIFGALGLMLYWLGHKRRPVEIYTN